MELTGFRRILAHPQLRSKPFILETPVEEPGDDRRNLEMRVKKSMPEKPYDHNQIELKWHERWKDATFYKAEENSGRPKFYVLEMLPYPSGTLHIKQPQPARWYSPPQRSPR